MPTDIPLPMIGLFKRSWWVLLLRGIVAILFGIFALSRPGPTLAAMVVLFGLYALMDGVFSLFAGIGGWSNREDRWLLVLEGLIGLGAGFVTLHAPALTAVALVFFIALWALATGVLKIVEAVRLRNEISGEFWWLALSGALSVAFAFLVMLRPLEGALALAWVIGWFAVFLGVMLVMLSFRLRGLRRRESVEEGTTYRRVA